MVITFFMKRFIIVVKICVVFFCFKVNAQSFDFNELVISELNPSSNYGTSVSVHENVLVVGAPGIESGQIYIYSKNKDGEWDYETILSPNENQVNMDYGDKVFVTEKYLAVSAPYYDSGRGVVYVYEKDENEKWTNEQILMSSDGESGDKFGKSISIFEDQIIIGAAKYNANGCVYVYEKTDSGSWSNEQKIMASDAVVDDHFGFFSTMTSSHLYVGAPCAIHEGDYPGAVYVYEKDSLGLWGNEFKILPTNTNPFINTNSWWFGSSISIFDNKMAIGAQKAKNGSGITSGAVLTYELNPDNTWDYKQKIQQIAWCGDFNRFGASVALNNEKLFVSAWGEPGIYLFELNEENEWVEEDKFSAGGLLGKSISMWGEDLVAGAPYSYNSGFNSGAVYVNNFVLTSSVDNLSLTKNVLFQNSPNPFNGETIIRFELAKEEKAEITVINSQGKIVRKIDGQFKKGLNHISIKDINPSGTYFYTLKFDGFESTKKMIIIE